jgi:hypothetical protein
VKGGVATLWKSANAVLLCRSVNDVAKDFDGESLNWHEVLKLASVVATCPGRNGPTEPGNEIVRSSHRCKHSILGTLTALHRTLPHDRTRKFARLTAGLLCDVKCPIGAPEWTAMLSRCAGLSIKPWPRSFQQFAEIRSESDRRFRSHYSRCRKPSRRLSAALEFPPARQGATVRSRSAQDARRLDDAKCAHSR